MRFEKSVEERHTVIKLLEEKLDSQIAPALKSEMVNLNAQGVRNVLLNLSEVKYVDSSGLSSILTANRVCAAAQGILAISNINPHVEKLIKISQLETVLKIFPTESEARDEIHMLEVEKDILSEKGEKAQDA
ncbi:MAG: STAS domain-containing protein [Bacteroidota bacterium]